MVWLDALSAATIGINQDCGLAKKVVSTAIPVAVIALDRPSSVQEEAEEQGARGSRGTNRRGLYPS